MGVVAGGISIKDNVTAVLRGIKQEQSSFRSDVKATKVQLQATWDKKRTAKLDATAAAKKVNDLKKRLEPLRKKVVTAMAIKDMAMSKVKAVGKKITDVGKLVAKPVINVVTKGTQAIGAIGGAMAKVAKGAAIAGGAVVAATGLALKAVFNGSMEAATSAIEAETKLAQVMKNTTGATNTQIKSVIDMAKAQERIGVISADVQTGGLQELGTYISEVDSLKKLGPVMNDMLAQQYGLNASQENAVNIATMMGKVLNGQVGGLSKLGYSFDANQEKILKYGTEAQKVATLTDVISQSVGGMNKAMTDSPLGKIKQMENAYEAMKEEVGRVGISIKGKVADVIMKNMPVIEQLGTTLMNAVGGFADYVIPKVAAAISYIAPLIEKGLKRVMPTFHRLRRFMVDIFSGFRGAADTVLPVVADIINGFKPLTPQLQGLAKTLFGTMQKVAASVMPAVASIMKTVQSLIPVIVPVLESVMTTIGSLISRAAPVIAGMVEGVSTIIKTLAPVFTTIFEGIAEKVGTVIDFVSSKMGFIQEVIGFVAPMIADILTTVWGVIGPVIDGMINIFKTIFNVVQRIWPGIQKILETVWGIIKPIVDSVGWVISKIAGAFGLVADKMGGDGKAGTVGSNANGTNNWRGGPTWVGERGPELVDLPKGSRVLPNKESLQVAKGALQPTITSPPPPARSPAPEQGGAAILSSIEHHVAAIIAWLGQQGRKGTGAPNIQLTIAKIADQVIVRENGDIDRLTEQVGQTVIKQVLLALSNV